MKKTTVFIIILALLLLAGLAIGIVWLSRDGGEEPAPEQETSQQTPENTEAVTEVVVPDGIALEHGLVVNQIGSYTGAFVEDGSNEFVSGVIMLRVTNTGEEDIQYAEITMPVGYEVAQFSFSTLPVGKSVVLLEKNRMLWSGEENCADPALSLVAKFQSPISLQEDLLQIQALDGCLNVTNISGNDISGLVYIYYKNAQQGLYYGGITYRVGLENGLKAGEVVQIMADHFSATGSEVVFITIS